MHTSSFSSDDGPHIQVSPGQIDFVRGVLGAVDEVFLDTMYMPQRTSHNKEVENVLNSFCEVYVVYRRINKDLDDEQIREGFRTCVMENREYLDPENYTSLIDSLSSYVAKNVKSVQHEFAQGVTEVMKGSNTPINIEQRASAIIDRPADFKACHGCDSIVARKVGICPNCHSYKYFGDPDKPDWRPGVIRAHAIEISKR